MLTRTETLIKETEVLDDLQVAKILNVSRKTVQEMARNPKMSGLVGRKITRKWRFHRDAIKNCLLGK